MLNKGMQSMFEDYKPTNEPTLRIVVSLQTDKLVEDLAQAYVGELIRVAGPVGEKMLVDVDAEGIRKYLSTLSFMRRARVAGLSNKITVAYSALYRRVAVPVFWYQVLISIGKAIDRDYSIEFIPGTSIEESDLLSPEDMLHISDVMFRLQNNGFSVVAGLPLSEEGDLEFMAMAHVGEQVLSYRKSHPVYGFLASFFASHEVQQTLGALVRIKYGYDADYRVMLSRVVACVGGEG